MSLNYYEILEIPSDADEREIKKAYHRFARALHPDKAENPDQVKEFEQQFAQVTAAYNTLKDGDKRSEYDQKLKTEKASGTNGKSKASSGGSSGSGGSGMSATASVLKNDRKDNSNRGSGLTNERAGIAKKAYARGMQFYKEGNFAKAAEFFEAAIQNHDGEAIYHSKLAASLIQAHRSATKALDHAQRACDLDPYNMDHKFVVAAIFERIGSKTNAKKAYEEILRWEEGNSRARTALSNLEKNKANSFGLEAAKGSLSHDKPGFLQQIMALLKK